MLLQFPLPNRTFILAISTLAVLIVYLAYSYTQETEALSFPAVTPLVTNASLHNAHSPVRLVIPAITVDAHIQSVGRTVSGSMGVPDLREDVAWYEIGTTPGEVGSAVIAGHYGWKNKEVSAFDKLHQVRIGDLVYVQNVDKEVIVFKVRDIRTYNADDLVSNVFTSNDKKSRLNLITCEGTWNKTRRMYSTRRVVFTERI